MTKEKQLKINPSYDLGTSKRESPETDVRALIRRSMDMARMSRMEILKSKFDDVVSLISALCEHYDTDSLVEIGKPHRHAASFTGKDWSLVLVIIINLDGSFSLQSCDEKGDITPVKEIVKKIFGYYLKYITKTKPAGKLKVVR